MNLNVFLFVLIGVPVAVGYYYLLARGVLALADWCAKPQRSRYAVWLLPFLFLLVLATVFGIIAK